MIPTARMPGPLGAVESWYLHRMSDLMILGFPEEREIVARAFRSESRTTTSRAATDDEIRHSGHVRRDPMCLFCVLGAGDPA